MHVLGQIYGQINCYCNQIVLLKLQKYSHTEIIVVSKMLKDTDLFALALHYMLAFLLWLKCHGEGKKVWLEAKYLRSKHLAQPPFCPAFCSFHLMIISLPQNTVTEYCHLVSGCNLSFYFQSLKERLTHYNY